MPRAKSTSQSIGAAGAVTVRGGGSTLTSNILFVGCYYGSGTLDICDGDVLNSSVTYIGSGAGATGVVTVTGPGSLWNAGIFYVGENSSKGKLNITDGGQVNGFGLIGEGRGATGIMTVRDAGSRQDSNPQPTD
jgi:T5SS/PEP-CTERM-associated repeat protein